VHAAQLVMSRRRKLINGRGHAEKLAPHSSTRFRAPAAWLPVSSQSSTTSTRSPAVSAARWSRSVCGPTRPAEGAYSARRTLGAPRRAESSQIVPFDVRA
jgi:hypothetical protein